MGQTFDSNELGNAASGTAEAGKGAVKAGKAGKKAFKAAKALKKMGMSGAKSAAKAAIAAKAPIIAGVIAGSLVVTLILAPLTVGMISMITNSTSRVTPSQDPLTEAQEQTAMETLGNSYATERECLNILGRALGEQENEAYEDLEKLCKQSGLSKNGYEATLQFLQTNGFSKNGDAILNFAEQNSGMWTDDEMNAAIMLSAYSISMDNLWGKEDDSSDAALSGVDIDANPNAKDAKGRALYIYSRLRGAGYSHNAACGILGNLENESGGFNPKSVNASGHMGIVQWDGTHRGGKLKKLAKSKGKKWTDLSVQVDFMIQELSGSYYKSTGKKLKKKNVSLATAVDVFMRNYEAPGNYDKNGPIRLKSAKKWDKKFSQYKDGGAASASSSAATSGTDPAANAKKYKKYKKLATIDSGDVSKWMTLKAEGSYVLSQSMVWMGNNTFAATLITRGNEGMVVKYSNGRRVAKKKASEINHSNGIAYNASEGKLYVCKAKPGGGNRRALSVFRSDDLKHLKSRKINANASSIGYDNATGRYVINGTKVRFYDKNFNRLKQSKRVKGRTNMQDVNCFNGIAFVTEYTGGSSASHIYRMSDGAYLGSLALSLGEIEEVCVDDSGHLLLINAHRTIYKTKKKVSSYVNVPDKEVGFSGGAGGTMSAEDANTAVRNAIVQWGIEKGNDNKYHYGRKPAAQNLGCSECGTNTPKKCDKGKGKNAMSAKEMAYTWSCCTFVTACVVHGGQCKGFGCMHGWIGTGENYNKDGYFGDKYLAKSPYWKKLKNPSYSDLLPGDIIIFKTHTTIYAGDGKLIQSHGGDNGKANSKKWNRSIGLWHFDKKKYKKRKHIVYRYVGGAEGTKLDLGELGAGGSSADGYGAKNWRKDMPAKVEAYFKSEDHKELYKLTYAKDPDTGQPIVYDGVVDTSVNERLKNKITKKENVRYKLFVRKWSEDKQVRNGHKKRTEDISQASRIYSETQKLKRAKKKKPKLKNTQYIDAKIEMKQSDLVKLSFEMFGVTNETIEKNYGSLVGGGQAVREMAENTIAVMHNVEEFSEDTKVENPQYSEELPYKIEKQIGWYEIDGYCGCNRAECKQHRQKLFGTATMKSGVKRVAGITGASGNVRQIPIGSVIYNPKVGIITITEQMKQTQGDKIAIYCGKKHKEAAKMIKKLRKFSSLTQSGKLRLFTTSGMTQKQAFDYWNNLTGGGGGPILQIAAKEIGNVGGSKFKSWYGMNADWCAMFVSWCADQAGLIKSGKVTKTAAAQGHADYFKKKGTWKGRDYTPKPGDIVLFDYEPNGVANHVGIVEKVVGDKVHTIEGNYSNRVQRVTRSKGDIMGYGAM